MSEAVMQPRGWTRRSGIVAALIWCGFVLFAHWAVGAFACGMDTSYCAQSRHKDGLYRGVLTPNTSFTVDFESSDVVGGFSTDAAGRYCIVWAQESTTPYASLPSGQVPLDYNWQPLNGAAPPAGCQAGDKGIPWRRAEDLRTSPQYLAPFVVGLIAVALLLIGLGVPRVRRAGLWLTLATTALAILVWAV